MSESVNQVEPEEGSAFRFFVRSDVTAEKYLCDIAEAQWTGWCSCPHFLCRLAPKIAQGERGPSVRCKHLRKSREFFLEMILPKIAKALGQEEPEVFETARPASEYMKLRNEFLAKHRRCAVFPALFATEVHHAFGRGNNLLLETRLWIPVSRLGHNFVDANRNKAREMSWNGIPLLAPLGEWNNPNRERLK